MESTLNEKDDSILEIERFWDSRWEDAIKIWSLYTTKLKKPIFITDKAALNKMGRKNSFASINLTDLSIMVSLIDVKKLGLEKYPIEILAHEIGHHIYTPGDLGDQGRLLARINRGLMDLKKYSPLVANLYTDLLVNEKLFRLNELKLDEVYKKLKDEADNNLWNFYMRIYEILWALEKGTLTSANLSSEIEGDSQLANRLIKSYRDEWLKGASRFASLCYPYLVENENKNAKISGKLTTLLDTNNVGNDSSEIPNGLSEIDEDEIGEVIHPSLEGVRDKKDRDIAQDLDKGGGLGGGQNYREPFEYGEILRSLGLKLSDNEISRRYYKERALPYLIPFPKKEMPRSKDPLIEGYDQWDISSPIDEINWFETIIKSPYVIPGITTYSIHYGEDSGNEKSFEPIDLDIYVDSSGSMPNPNYNVSYLTLAGAIIALSALKAGSAVQATLWSGKNQFVKTNGFTRDEDEILKILSSFYGGATAFPIHILRDTYTDRKKTEKKVHILVISDDGVTTMFDKDEKNNSGWDIAKMALTNCGAGGTFVLNLYREYTETKDLVTANNMGWDIYRVSEWEELISFSKKFVKKHYVKEVIK